MSDRADVRRIGDLLLDEETVRIDVVEIDEEDLLEAPRPPCRLSRSMTRNVRSVTAVKSPMECAARFQPIGPLAARCSARCDVELVDDEPRWSASVVSAPSSIG